jgi:hypothetical protein
MVVEIRGYNKWVGGEKVQKRDVEGYRWQE